MAAKSRETRTKPKNHTWNTKKTKKNTWNPIFWLYFARMLQKKRWNSQQHHGAMKHRTLVMCTWDQVQQTDATTRHIITGAILQFIHDQQKSAWHTCEMTSLQHDPTMTRGMVPVNTCVKGHLSQAVRCCNTSRTRKFQSWNHGS